MSSTVASAFAHFGDPATFETERFVRMFDKFFDCLNVRSFTECTEKRKPDVRPYRSKDDPRFDVSFHSSYTKCETNFMHYYKVAERLLSGIPE